MITQLPIKFPEISALKSFASKAEEILEKKLADFRKSPKPGLGTSDIEDKEVTDVYKSPHIIAPFRYIVDKHREEKTSENDKRHDGSWPEERDNRIGEILITTGFDDRVVLTGLYGNFFNYFSKGFDDIGRLAKEIWNQTKDKIVVETALQHANKYQLLFKALSLDSIVDVEVGKLSSQLKALGRKTKNKKFLSCYNTELGDMGRYLKNKGRHGRIDPKSMEAELYQDHLIGALGHSEENRIFYSVFLANLLDDTNTSSYMSINEFLELTKKNNAFLGIDIDGDKNIDKLKTRLAYTTMEKIFLKVNELKSDRYLAKNEVVVEKLLEIYEELKREYGESILSMMKKKEKYLELSMKYQTKGKYPINKFTNVIGSYGAGGNFSTERRGDNTLVEINLVIRDISPEELIKKIKSASLGKNLRYEKISYPTL